jgi:porphobilinogen synthase
VQIIIVNSIVDFTRVMCQNTGMYTHTGFCRQYPATRLRRLRSQAYLRDLVRETTLSVQDLIYPVFVVAGTQQRQPIPTMPGIARLSPDVLLEELKEVIDLGIRAVALFPVIDQTVKSALAEEAYNPAGLLPTTVRLIKQHLPQLIVMTDIALDPYTNHGHDGILAQGPNAELQVANEPTIEILCQQALTHAQAGADILAPSDMMDGRIAMLRQTLETHNFPNLALLSYAAKYASAYYGPFRQAVGSAPASMPLDKRHYQMDPANANEALHEVALDLQEGADIVMIKPGLPYLDIIYRVKQTFMVPTFAYQVSGEYNMLITSANQQNIELQPLVMEALIALKRAGSDAIVTYFAKQAAKWLTKA